jgi:rhodanese-related sulfurtransferase
VQEEAFEAVIQQMSVQELADYLANPGLAEDVQVGGGAARPTPRPRPGAPARCPGASRARRSPAGRRPGPAGLLQPPPGLLPPNPLACTADPPRPRPRPAAQFVDVREPDEFRTSKLPLFQLFPLSTASEWAPTIDQALDPRKQTVVLCHHGVRSMQASQFLASRGFEDVWNVTGGIHAYSQGVDSSVPMY